jgi:hypothetical protein
VQRREGELLFNGYRVAVWDKGKTQEENSSDDYTVLLMQ